MKIDVLTIFPEMFGPVVTESILGRANQSGLLDRIALHDVSKDRVKARRGVVLIFQTLQWTVKRTCHPNL